MNGLTHLFCSTNKSVSDNELLSMSKKQSKESNDNDLRSLGLSRNVNDYDTGEPIGFNIAETESKKKMGVNKRFEVKIGNKSKTIKRFSAS